MASEDVNTDTFADVVVEYRCGSRPARQMKCHKAILAAKSGYLRNKLADLDSEELDGVTVLHLDESAGCEDDIQALIKYIYTSEYTIKGEDYWYNHIDRARLAQKYAVGGMEAKALVEFERWFENEDTDHVVVLIRDWEQHHSMSDNYEAAVHRIRAKYIDDIVCDPGHALRTDDKEIMQKCLAGLRCVDNAAKCEHCSESREVYIPQGARCQKVTYGVHAWSIQRGAQT